MVPTGQATQIPVTLSKIGLLEEQTTFWHVPVAESYFVPMAQVILSLQILVAIT